MSGPVGALNLIFSTVSDAAFAVSGGCLLAIGWLKGESEPIRVLRRVFLACVGGLVLGQIVRPWFVAASMSGSDNFTENLALVPDILASTHAGKVWCLGSLGLLALLASVLFAKRKVMTIGVAALFLMGCAKAASGHAAGDGDFTLAEFSMLLHVLGTAVWAGTVIVSGLIVIPSLAKYPDPSALWNYAQRLSRTVTWALMALLLSGIFNSWRELNGSLGALWSSDWGRILLVKIVFVSLALALGAVTRFRCVQHSATAERAEMMVRLVRAEGCIMIVILCLSGLLGTTAPA